jgi:hypothetical protein
LSYKNFFHIFFLEFLHSCALCNSLCFFFLHYFLQFVKCALFTHTTTHKCPFKKPKMS